MFNATFVLSTGRCGTQWLAEKIKASYKDALLVEHEPLHNRYEPRLMLGAKSPAGLAAEGARGVLDHVDSVERRLETGDYLECGHPCWSSLPYLAERFAGRIRIVHLVRHPLPTALSWVTHSAFVPPFLPHLKEKVLLSPFDPGVWFTGYRERWPSMSPVEKCLYYWAEVNAFGLRLEETARTPWLRLSFEELFDGPGLGKLLDFLNLEVMEPILRARTEVVDQHRFVSASGLPGDAVFEAHPAIAGVARELGYEPESVDREALRRRYAGG